MAKASRSSLPGSSPLARGTGRFVKWNEPPTRFIPAGAGNRLLEALEGLAEAVHPRWRGEQGTFDTENGWLGGSSPLARGTVFGLALGGHGGRFIPAGAGNRASWSLLSMSRTVHPRWRGEQRPSKSAKHGDSGSSPLARGTVCWNPAGVSVLRFIPAGAGNRPAANPAGCAAAVHPRWRGEQSTRCPSRLIICGSSPLARGTAAVCHSSVHPARFIPAGAGNSVSDVRGHQSRTVHPRWRGEQGRTCLVARTTERFIPAGAGNRTRPPTLTAQTPVHPRWRGEQRRQRAGFARANGSSPLARGTVCRMP